MGESNSAAEIVASKPELVTSGLRPRKRSKVPAWLWFSLLAVFLAVILPLALYGYGRVQYIRSYNIPSGAMEPTLKKGSLQLGDRLPYMLGDPQHGDVAVFRYPKDPSLDYVKRVIGVPGDVVELNNRTVLVNEEVLSEPYISEPAYADFGPETVPEGHYFVLGDNRNHSSDSRVWGFVPRENFVTRIIGH